MIRGHIRPFLSTLKPQGYVNLALYGNLLETLKLSYCCQHVHIGLLLTFRNHIIDFLFLLIVRFSLDIFHYTEQYGVAVMYAGRLKDICHPRDAG
jgi:hypothetical protein